MSDFFVLGAAALVGVFATLVASIQHLQEQLKTTRAANDYLARRLSSELYAREERILSAPDDEVPRYRMRVDREVRDYLHGEVDHNPHAWEMRGNPRSYR